MIEKTKIIIVALIIGLILTACGPSQAEMDATSTQVAMDIYATQTALAPTATSTFTPSPTATHTPTLTPTPTSTNTPTPTATPTPGLESVAITLDDLPPGYEEMPRNQINNMSGSLPEGSGGFGFSETEQFRMIMGFVIPFEKVTEQVAFDAMMPQFAQLFAVSLGADSNMEDLSGIDTIGQARSGVSAVGQMASLSMRWDIVTFRRGEVAILLILGYPDGNDPDISAVDLSRLMDERIILYLTPSIFQTPINADSIAGTWTGTIIGTDGSIVSEVVLEIQNGCSVEQVCGTVSASKFPCSGNIFLKQIIGNTFVFEEQDMSGADTCFSGGLEYIRLLSNGSLLWRFEFNGSIGSKAVLKNP